MKKLFQISLFVGIMLLLAYTPAKQDSLSKSIQIDTLNLNDSLDLKLQEISMLDSALTHKAKHIKECNQKIKKQMLEIKKQSAVEDSSLKKKFLYAENRSLKD